VRVELGGQGADAVRLVGQKLARALGESAFPPCHPLVLLMRENLGKALGQYATGWGTLPVELVVIDEVAVRDARFVRVGAARDEVVPVSFYGLFEPGGPT
jgi:ethanolamine utilization protein EutA